MDSTSGIKIAQLILSEMKKVMIEEEESILLDIFNFIVKADCYSLVAQFLLTNRTINCELGNFLSGQFELLQIEISEKEISCKRINEIYVFCLTSENLGEDNFDIVKTIFECYLEVLRKTRFLSIFGGKSLEEHIREIGLSHVQDLVVEKVDEKADEESVQD